MGTLNLKANATTNTQEDSVCTLQAGCDTMWSLAQQFAYRRLSTREQGVVFPAKRSIYSNYAHRARIIAATYARFYLELEENGNPKKKGRYYWMALGAFASKTVACTLDLNRVDIGKMAPDFTGLGYVRDGLGKGNFWLFQDIAPTHWYHNYSPGTFDQCLDTRGENGCHQQVIDNMKRLPWADTALPTLKYLPISGFIKSAFATVKSIEKTTGKRERAEYQLSHLMDIAQHEQGVILQPLMYDDPEFAKWVQYQRGWMSWLSPELELVLTHACETKDPKLKSVAPEETVLENFESRMSWIKQAAKQFHNLMQTKNEFMEKELRTMAGWYVSKD